MSRSASTPSKSGGAGGAGGVTPAVAFQETMRGTLETALGEISPVEFEVLAESMSLRDFLRNGMTRLRGILRAPAWTGVDEVPAEGSLRLSSSALEYRVYFLGREGARLTLEGVKHPSVLAPLASMTNMQATLRDEHSEILARGSMLFDVNEMLEFTLSWLPVLPLGRLGRRRLDARRLSVQRALLERDPGEFSASEGTVLTGVSRR